MTVLLSILLALVLVSLLLGLLYVGRGYWAWVVPGALAILAGGLVLGFSSAAFLVIALVFAAIAALFGVPALRRSVLTARLMPVFAKLLPRMGETERVALDAGTVWWDGELFSGAPRWTQLLGFQQRPLSLEERAFLDGPVQQLCAMIDEWSVEQARDLPPEVWEFMKRSRFFGMIIPKEYGGLGFSALAHSAVVLRIASRSVTAAVTVMVPNSLGPAELLLHYGTDEQRRHYLPRLASGEEIPCFALTGPEAGSDAAATQSTGVVCYGTYEGRSVLGMRLTFSKRYITLAPVATLIGLAFRLLDPARLLGGRTDLGITCALIPAKAPGVEIGARHDPMGIPFQNGPINGKDVFVPLDFIIGGPALAGHGWRMLMECLAAGRSVSLPALSVGEAQLAVRTVGAYATVREQFDTPIGRFEGIEEPLARIGGLTYLMNAARTLTAGAVDAGEKPAVVSAIVKAYLTEAVRVVVNDAMDIRAGAAICRGPRNPLAHTYVTIPLGITVEGANILTRSMIIYGQGAIRCHAYVRDEMAAIAERDVVRFDRALFGHMNQVGRNAVRALLLALTGGQLARHGVRGPLGGYISRLSRMSAAFAVISDVAMATLGGKLKRHEKLSGRLADMLAWLYLASASIKKFWDEGQPQGDLPMLRWSCEYSIYRTEQALLGLLDNFGLNPVSRIAAWLLRPLLLPLGARSQPPSDVLGAEVARGLLEDREERLRLTQDIFIPPPSEVGLGRLEAALDRAVEALAVESKLRDAVRRGVLDRAPGEALADLGLAAGIITHEERQRVHDADEAREEAIRVDAFDPDTFALLSRRPLGAVPASRGKEAAHAGRHA